MDPMDALKQMAAFRAVEQIHSDMVVGLGTGSTAKFAIERIGERLADGDIRNIVGIPSSVKTEKQAQAAAIPLVTLQDHPAIDITIDGADEVNPDLELIKGGGGALLREKILAQASARNVIIVDESKLSHQLGIRWALPVEVVPFAGQVEENYLKHLGASVELRKDNNGNPYRTDQKNIILDAKFGPISNPLKLASRLDARAGIMAHGLFVGLATEVIVAETNQIRHLKRNNTRSERLFY